MSVVKLKYAYGKMAGGDGCCSFSVWEEAHSVVSLEAILAGRTFRVLKGRPAEANTNLQRLTRTSCGACTHDTMCVCVTSYTGSMQSVIFTNHMASSLLHSLFLKRQYMQGIMFVCYFKRDSFYKKQDYAHVDT